MKKREHPLLEPGLDMKERLAETVLQLEHERHWRARYETDLSSLRAQRDAEVTDLLANVRKQGEELAWQRQLVRGLQDVRPAVFEKRSCRLLWSARRRAEVSGILTSRSKTTWQLIE
ncbi:unnamed protein product [Prorocentrum cordatum]|uniref:Uncharacterized protein n=1 Tax=Prorocentrum cordatum TaxID=2364126 RepID=A0ABN9WPY4_9DINO|nr:unnamed protein product [Polarella glacialis]